MKKLNFINKIIFLINNIFAVLLLLSFLVPYIKPSSFSLAPIIGLTIPALFFINVLFVIYWIIIGFRKQFLLSAFVLLLAYFFSTPIYKFSSDSGKNSSKSLKIMSYNVRKFNTKRWINDTSIPTKISDFIRQENPDILALQEFVTTESTVIDYPYVYNPKVGRHTSGLALYSKYPVVNQGKVFSKKHEDRIIFIDILKNNDTLRIYNFHLQSLGLVPEEEYLGQKNSDRLIGRLKKAFKAQQEQLLPLKEAQNKHTIKTILVGDMNNTAYSWAYKNLKGNLKDSYLKKGSGFGKTYNFRGFPLRIDYILADEKLEVLNHKNYEVTYSDHYPIMATISF